MVAKAGKSGICSTTFRAAAWPNHKERDPHYILPLRRRWFQEPLAKLTIRLVNPRKEAEFPTQAVSSALRLSRAEETALSGWFPFPKGEPSGKGASNRIRKFQARTALPTPIHATEQHFFNKINLRFGTTPMPNPVPPEAVASHLKTLALLSSPNERQSADPKDRKWRRLWDRPRCHGRKERLAVITDSPIMDIT